MKIPIKKYVMDESLSWEERYHQLEAHHQKETEWLIEKLESLVKYTREFLERVSSIAWDTSEDHRGKARWKVRMDAKLKELE